MPLVEIVRGIATSDAVSLLLHSSSFLACEPTIRGLTYSGFLKKKVFVVTGSDLWFVLTCRTP